MKKCDAVAQSVKEVDATKGTRFVLRRGDNYLVSKWPDRKGWKVAESIAPGNVQNFREVSA